MSFPAYPAYKESGIEWLGYVPIDWTLSKVKYDSYVKARVGWHGLKSEEFTDEGPYLVTGSDFKNRTVEWSSCYHCTEERFRQDKYIQLEEGDLLITKDGTIGKLILVEGLPGNATLNSGIFVVRPLQKKYSTRFYLWIMQSSVFYDFIGLNKMGSTIVHLYQETFGNLPYALPGLADQIQIARFLDHETARIDALIEEQQRLIELLKEKRQAVISHAVTKGLDPTVPMQDSGVEWLGEVPAHWDVSRLKYHSTKIGDGLHATPEYDDEGGYFFINGNNLVGGGIVITPTTRQVNHQEFVKHRVQLDSSTLLISINGTIGNTAIYSGERVILGKSAAYINCRESLSRVFCLYLLSSEQIKRFFDNQLTGTTISNLSLRSIAETPTPLPSRDEQQAIVEFLKHRINEFDKLIENTVKLSQLLQERRSALISAAVTGKIDVRDWRPPAGTQAPVQELEEAV